MLYTNLGERFKAYEHAYDSTLIHKLPVIIRCDGRSFSRLAKQLPQPFCPDLSEIMTLTMLECVMEMQGAVFAYQHQDKISFILRNDQTLDAEPWYQNRIQKMVSITASLVTLAFNRLLARHNPPLEVTGDAIFDARVFAVPNIAEAVNYLIWQQQSNLWHLTSKAVQIELSAKLGKKITQKLLQQKTLTEKKELLLEQTGIEFEHSYPIICRHGTAAYKIPIVIPSKQGSISRKKWTLNENLPLFTEEKDFVYNILLNGYDIYRAPNILTDL